MKELPEYLAFLRLQACAKCGRKGGQVHHEPMGLNAVGSKPPDTFGLPICAECHRARHDMGWQSFWGDAFAYLPGQMLRYLTRFLCGERR